MRRRDASTRGKCTLTRSIRSFGLGSFEWLDNEVVKLGQDICWKKVDLEFNLLGVLKYISGQHEGSRIE